MQEREKDLFDIVSLVKLAWSGKWILISSVVFVAAVTYFVTRTITPIYESHSIVYPSVSTSKEKQLEEFTFGYELQAERLMQLLNSVAVYDSLNNRFDLANYYKVDKSQKSWYDRYLTTARKRIQFHKTRYASITISVQDEVPEMAANIANEVCVLVNEINANIVKNSAMGVLKSVEEDYTEKKTMITLFNDSIVAVQNRNRSATMENINDQTSIHIKAIKSIGDSLDKLRKKYMIFDYGYQVNILNEKLAKAKSDYYTSSGIVETYSTNSLAKDSVYFRHLGLQKGAQTNIEMFEKELEQLVSINASYNSLVDRLEIQNKLLENSLQEGNNFARKIEPQIETYFLQNLRDEYKWDQNKLKEFENRNETALTNYTKPSPVAIVVESARPSYIPIYPKKLLSVVILSFTTFFLVFMGLVLKQRIDTSNK